jgi:hypothetical protein
MPPASDPKARLALVGERPCPRVGRKMAGVSAGPAEKLQRQTLSLAAVRHASQERPSTSAREHIDTAPPRAPPPNPIGTKALPLAFDGKTQIPLFLVAGNIAAMLPFLQHTHGLAHNHRQQRVRQWKRREREKPKLE